MIAAFIQFDDETVLVLGLSTRDLMVLFEGAEPPPMNLTKMAAHMGCPPPTRLQVITGANDDDLNSRVRAVLGEDVASFELSRRETRDLLGLEPTGGDLAAAEAEEAAIKRAKNARFN